MKERIFKTAWFTKAASKAQISDAELFEAILSVLNGQADDLGGGVYKKRLNKNKHRSIIIAKGGKYWVYEYLFAKKDRANISQDELLQFKAISKGYAKLSDQKIAELIQEQHFTEITNEC
jgi:hypothetical protein